MCFQIEIVDVMKWIFQISLFITIFLMTVSCSSDTSDTSEIEKPSEELVTDYSYNESEVELMHLINQYRENIGLKALIKVNHISFKSEEHSNYMIANRVVNHDNFTKRTEKNIIVLGAHTVWENVA